ncbi:hypothetical protein [Roseivivax lentus]|nr:hypothetical protein [Roseivivax lentus]
MILALIGSSFFGGIAALFGFFGLEMGIGAALALYLGIAFGGMALALIAQMGRSPEPALEPTRAS